MNDEKDSLSNFKDQIKEQIQELKGSMMEQLQSKNLAESIKSHIFSLRNELLSNDGNKNLRMDASGFDAINERT